MGANGTIRAAPRMPIRIGAASLPVTDATLALVPARSVTRKSEGTHRSRLGAALDESCLLATNVARATSRGLRAEITAGDVYGVRTPKLADTRLHSEVSVWRTPLAGSIRWVPAVTTWVRRSAILRYEGRGYLRSVAVAVRFGSPAPRWAV
jgi:hypothetical protein